MRPRPYALETPVRTETPYGGRTVVWTPSGTVWLTLAPAAPHEVEGGDRPPERTEAAQAHGRTHPTVNVGVRLTSGDETPWVVRAVLADPDAPGRMRLRLDRLL